jgi:hypothetical protein
MKIIVSHDVDHLTVSEHFTDAIIPKFLFRMNIELFLGKISFKEAYLRLKNLSKNKWNNIKELIAFDEIHDVPGTFFVGVNNDLGLNYRRKLSEKWIAEIISCGFDCGVHGISYINQELVVLEYKTFKEISGLTNFGIRMHYLRNNSEILQLISNAGYLFDSSDYGMSGHYKIGQMFEYPLHIMEKYEIEGKKKWQINTTKEAIKSSINNIKAAEKINIKYLTILFHDFYFDDSFITWKNWYIELIKYCKSEGYQFINYRDAIKDSCEYKLTT